MIMNLKELAKLTVTTDSLFGGLSGVAKAHIIAEQTGQLFDITKTQQILTEFNKECEEFELARQALEDARKAAIEKEVQVIAERVLSLLGEYLGLKLPNGEIVPWNTAIKWSCHWGSGIIQQVGGHKVVGSKHGERIDLGKLPEFPNGAKELAKMVRSGELKMDSKGSQLKLVQLFVQSMRGLGVQIWCGAWGADSCPRFGDRGCHRIELKVVERT